MKKEAWFLGLLLVVWVVACVLPLGNGAVQNGILEAFRMLQWYAMYHTLGCVVPAMFIAGAISTFLRKESVLKYLGAGAKPWMAYGVASVSGVLLAVCSCSVLPMFAGIYRVGAGLGPAAAFLCSGPALNVMAIFLSARVLGVEMGLGRTILAILMSLVVGGLMGWIFRKSEVERTQIMMQLPEPLPGRRKTWQTVLWLGTMVIFLVFSDWVSPGTTVFTLPEGSVVTSLNQAGQPEEKVLASQTRAEVSITQQTLDEVKFQVLKVEKGDSQTLKEGGEHFRVSRKLLQGVHRVVPPNYDWAEVIYQYRWSICMVLLAGFVGMTWRWFSKEEVKEWMTQTGSFAVTVVPMLFGGVFVTGFVASLLPAELIAQYVGGNSLRANGISSTLGMLWYFSTLSEIPMLQALTDLGMGKGPGMTLLLAGPTLSLPGILVLSRYLGWLKTSVFVLLIMVFATLCGVIFGSL